MKTHFFDQIWWKKNCFSKFSNFLTIFRIFHDQTCRGTGFGIGSNPCSARPDTKTRPYLCFSDTAQSMYRPGPIQKHDRTFGSPPENDDFYIKIINFDQLSKKNRLAAGPLPGVTLGGEHASGGPLRGG